MPPCTNAPAWMKSGSGYRFPTSAATGTPTQARDFAKLQGTMDGYSLLWPRQAIDADNLPQDGAIFDLVEYCL